MTMLSRKSLILGTGLAAAWLLTTAALDAQESTTTRPSSKADAPAAKRSFDPARRVPIYFGQIGLTPEQREAIYKIQAKHQAKINELERQVDEIQTQSLRECEGVLTETQKQLLTQRRKAAGRKGEEPERTDKEKS